MCGRYIQFFECTPGSLTEISELLIIFDFIESILTLNAFNVVLVLCYINLLFNWYVLYKYQLRATPLKVVRHAPLF